MSSKDIERMNRDELLKLKPLIDHQLSEAKTALTEAKALGYQGQYLPAEQFRALNARRAVLAKLSQRIQFRLGQLKTERKEANRENYGNRDLLHGAFYRLCMERLPPEQFEDLRAEAEHVVDSTPLTNVRGLL